jgi:hypothetical protein
MTKGDFITVVSNMFRMNPQGSVKIFDGLSELYDELMARQDTKESQATDA